MAASLVTALGSATLVRRTPRVQALNNAGLRHLVWVWQFSNDAEPDVLAAALRNHGLGILLKTHDAVEWMAKYDTSQYAVSGPAQVRILANYFETAGVPFHAWTVLHGSDPLKEAAMAAEVLASGARSIYLDVEPHSGFWRGTAEDAAAFGRELRRLQPDAEIALSIDARPWLLDAIPMQEFTAFSDLVAPQLYWRTFDTTANYTKFAASGYPVPEGGITPEFLWGVTQPLLANLGLTVAPVGQGATPDANEWRTFVESAFSDGSNLVSVWRYGVTSGDVLALLRDLPPPPPPAVLHVVQPGETLGGIAATYGTSVADLVSINGLSDPNFISIGQEILLPGGSVAATGPAVAPATEGGGTRPAGGEYVVQAGDTLSAIAARLGTSVGALVDANGIADPNLIFESDVLVVP